MRGHPGGLSHPLEYQSIRQRVLILLVYAQSQENQENISARMSRLILTLQKWTIVEKQFFSYPCLLKMTLSQSRVFSRHADLPVHHIRPGLSTPRDL